jgi:cytochrome c biogenesis protein CcmG/thiol:disulfide interchange protein DsbE
MERKIRWIAGAAAVALLSGLFLLSPALPSSSAQITGTDVGQTAPDFKLPPVGGGRAYSLSQFKGKPVVLIFWATWCPPCRREIPALKSLYERYTQKGVAVVTVTIDYRQTQEDVLNFQRVNELPYPILWDADNKVSDDWGVEGIPTNMVLDKKGVIRYRGHSMDDDLVSAIEGAIKN